MKTLRRGKTRRRLHEEAGGGTPRVDRDRGIIRGVKVLGLESQNGRRYLPAAVAKAKGLYEGRSVRIDHPRRPNDPRESGDVFGWLRDVREGQGGALFADLHFLKAHPMAARVCEAAERNPALFGLSHNVEVYGQDRDGVYEISEIVEVRSVDLVADPATTKGLFEGDTMRRGLRRRRLRELDHSDLGLDGDYDDSPPGNGGGDDGDGGEWKAHILRAVGALLDSEDPADHAKVDRLMKILKDGSLDAEDEEEEDEPGSPIDKGRREREAPGDLPNQGERDRPRRDDEPLDRGGAAREQTNNWHARQAKREHVAALLEGFKRTRPRRGRRAVSEGRRPAGRQAPSTHNIVDGASLARALGR